jgi:hypothetical protein
LWDFGKYKQAPEDAKYAFEKIEDLWEDEELESDDDFDDDANQTDDKTGSEPPNKKQRRSPRLDSNVDTTPPRTKRERAEALCAKVEASKDKVFIVKVERHGRTTKHSWHVARVDWEETDKGRAKKSGIYHMMFYVRSFKDSKKLKVKECQYWPEIHEFKKDGKTMGMMAPTSPNKVDNLLEKRPQRYMWYQNLINLLEDAVAGPFDFVNDHHIPETAWKELRAEAQDMDIYVGNLNRTIPLDKPDEQDGGYTFMGQIVTLDSSYYNG